MPGVDGEAKRDTSGRGGSILLDLGAEVQQGAGAERAGEHAREIDDANAGKRAAHVSAP
jgi:hypothetical protein